MHLTVALFWGAAGVRLGCNREVSWEKNFLEYQSLIQVLTFGSIFSQLNKGGKQGKKFVGYKNNIYEGQQDAIKEQMFSKVEATGKWTFKSICYKKNHQYLIWKFLEHEEYLIEVH